MREHRNVETSGAPTPAASFSQAIVASNHVWLAGQLGIDPATGTLSENVEDETHRVILNLQAVLAARGLTLDHVVRTTVYLTDLSDYQVVDAVYAHYFSRPYPARATVQVAGLLRGARVEIDGVAVIP